MKGNKYLALALSCILLFFTGCTGKNDNNKQIEGNNAIKLYLMEYTKPFMTKATKQFNDQYPDHTLDIEYFDNKDECRKRLNTELLSGKGPDFVLFDTYTFNSIYKALKSGVFCDLNPFIEADESFDMGNYNKTVMDCGIFDGKRYMIPLEYYIDTFITTEELLEENGININVQEWDIEHLTNTLKDFMDNGQARFFFDRQYPFSDYAVGSGIEFIDHENSKCYFNTPQFREVLNTYKDVFLKASVANDLRMKYGIKYWEMLKDNTAITAGAVNSLQSIWVANSFLFDIFKCKGRAYPLPTYDKTAGYSALPFDMVAINSNSNHKEIAYDMIKFMLSKELQLESSFYPVNEEAYDEQLKEYMGAAGNQIVNIKGTPLTTTVISEELAGDLTNIKNKLSRCIVRDEYIFDLLNDAAFKYVDGEYSEDQVINELESKVMLYLNE
jgi:multiple sugar transport system substrate-binding protein